MRRSKSGLCQKDNARKSMSEGLCQKVCVSAASIASPTDLVAYREGVCLQNGESGNVCQWSYVSDFNTWNRSGCPVTRLAL